MRDRGGLLGDVNVNIEDFQEVDVGGSRNECGKILTKGLVDL